MKRGLRGLPSEHARAFEDNLERASDAIKKGEKATACGEMYTAALQSSAASALAVHESNWAFTPHSFERKQADAQHDKLLKRAIRLDDKIRAKCLR